MVWIWGGGAGLLLLVPLGEAKHFALLRRFRGVVHGRTSVPQRTTRIHKPIYAINRVCVYVCTGYT